MTESQTKQDTGVKPDDGLTCWAEMLDDMMSTNNDTEANIEGCTISPEEMERRFDSGFGSAEGTPFTMWTKDWVYSDEEYDGRDSVHCVRRNPPTVRYSWGRTDYGYNIYDSGGCQFMFHGDHSELLENLVIRHTKDLNRKDADNV